MRILNNIPIRNKLIILVLAVNILVILIVGFVILRYTARAYHENMVEHSRLNARYVSDLCITALIFEDKKGAQEALERLSAVPTVQMGLLYNNQKQQFAAYYRDKKPAAVTIETDSTSHYFDEDFLHLFEAVTLHNQKHGLLYIKLSTENLKERIDKFRNYMLWILLGSVVITTILAGWFQRVISGPILKLESITRKITSQQDYGLRAPDLGTDETGNLAKSFNNMIAQIEKTENERNRALEESKENEEKFKKITTSANDGIILLDYEGKIVLWNQAAQSIFGYSFDEIAGAGLHNLLARPQDLQMYKKNFEHFQQTGTGAMIGRSQEFVAIHKTGEFIDVEISAASLNLKNRWHAVGMVKDITERKKHSQELEKARQRAEESDKLKSAFLANMSHEIRTPMNAIVGFADLLRRSDLDAEKRDQFIKVISKNSSVLLKLIDDILDISKIEAGQLSLSMNPIKPLHLLQELYQNFNIDIKNKEKYLLELRLNVDKRLDENFEITTDETRLQQVLNNLISNAIKFTSSGFVEIGGRIRNQKLQFFVKDTGIGLTQEQQKYIFSRFRQADSSTTRKYGGSGLGLAISKGIIEALGGSIFVESQLDYGSEFVVEFPLQNGKGLEDTVDKPDVAKGGDNTDEKVVLIVEDEESNYEYLREAISSIDVRILWARDGAPAVKLCETNSNIALVLMDIQMPDMNGYDATRKIKEIRPNLPVVVQTAYAMESEKKKSYEAGCDGYLAKPIKFNELIAIIEKYIGV